MAKTSKIKQNLMDRTIAVFDPVRARDRMAARMQMALAGGYSGASRTRRSLKRFNPRGGDANSDILPDLAALRDRSRDLSRNSPLSGGAISTVVTSVVGSGLRLKCGIDREALGLSKDEALAWEKQAHRLWKTWAGSQECDATRMQTFAGLQATALRSMLESGDVFVLLPMFKRAGSPFGLKLQMIEADRVENKEYAQDTSTLAGGVKMDSRGAPTHYQILKSHPGTFAVDRKNREWQEIPAFGARTGRRNVLHLLNKTRPGQVRGVPFLAPVIEPLKQLERYTEAELMAAVVSGMFTVFIETESGSADLDMFDPQSETGALTGDDDYKLGNGAIVGLAKGEKVSSENPGRPNTAFDPFIQSILKQIGIGLEIPYEVLIKHYSSSYSAARAALLSAWQFFMTRRKWLAVSLCQPVYSSFIGEQIAAGRLNAPGFFTDPMIKAAYLGAEWVGDPQGHIDEVKAVNAAKARIDARLSNHTIETSAMQAMDWERVNEQLEHELNALSEPVQENTNETV